MLWTEIQQRRLIQDLLTLYLDRLSYYKTTTNTITVNVGASPIVNHDVTDATYDNNAGVLVLTIGSHTLTAGTSVKMANNSLSFTCANDKTHQLNLIHVPQIPTTILQLTLIQSPQLQLH